MNKYYLEYHFNKKNFSKDELTFIEKARDMLKIGATIFEKQLNEDFYPKNSTKEEILEASKSNPLILNPYTVVKKAQNGLFSAVSFGKEYKNELDEIAKIASSCKKLKLKKGLLGYLDKLVKACLDSSWEELENYWLKIDTDKIDFQLAPIEPYIDSLLNIKHAFQGTLRILGDEKKFNPSDFIDVIKYMNTKSTYVENKNKEIKVKVRVDDVLASGGYQAYLPARGSNYPNDAEKVKEYGTKILIYTNNVQKREEEILFPVLTVILSENFLKGFSKKELFEGSIRNVLMHEIAEALIKYPDSQKRLSEMFLPVKELHASLMGAKASSFHVLKGLISHRDFETILLLRFVGMTFSDYVGQQLFGKSVNHYLRGYCAAFNYFIKTGAVAINKEHIWVNFPKLFMEVDRLSILFDDLMERGSFADAKRFFDAYEDYSFYKKFEDKLSRVVRITK